MAESLMNIILRASLSSENLEIERKLKIAEHHLEISKKEEHRKDTISIILDNINHLEIAPEAQLSNIKSQLVESIVSLEHENRQIIINDLKQEDSEALQSVAAEIKEQDQNKECYAGEDLAIKFEQEGLDYGEFRYKAHQDAKNYFKSIPNGVEQKIPLITHHIYFSDPNNPKELTNIYKDKLEKSITRLNDAQDGFVHYFWTNAPDIVPDKIRNLSGVHILDISEFQEDELYKNVKELLNSDKSVGIVNYVKASDIARLIVIKKYGGIYFDLDYEIYDAVEMLRHAKNFNFFGGFEFESASASLGNAFIAASAEHPVIREAVNLALRNSKYLNNIDFKDDIPEYIKRPCTLFQGVVDSSGPHMLTYAYAKANNQNDNIDFIFPAGTIFDGPYAQSKTVDSICYIDGVIIPDEVYFEGMKLKRLGADVFCGDWAIGVSFFDRINYKNKKEVNNEIKVIDNKQCYRWMEDIAEKFRQEGFDYEIFNNKIAKGAIDYFKFTENSNEQRIPLITHHIYFSNLKSPTELTSIYKDKLEKSVSRLNDAQDGFIHYFWTNTPDIIPNGIKTLNGVEICNLSEFEDHILYSHIKEVIEDEEPKETFHFVRASDIVRVMAVEKYGGIYFDLDYEIYNAPEMLRYTKNLNFFNSFECFAEINIGNAFIAASMEHPILTEAINLMQRNLHHHDNTMHVPRYIQRPCNMFVDIIQTTGPQMLTIAYEKANNQGNNVDLILPTGVIFDGRYAQYMTPLSVCHVDGVVVPDEIHFEGIKLKRAGGDVFCGNWGPPDIFDVIEYDMQQDAATEQQFTQDSLL